MTIGALEAYGSRRVAVITDDGTFTGRFDDKPVTDRAIVVLFWEDDARPGTPLVIDLERIRDVSPVE